MIYENPRLAYEVEFDSNNETVDILTVETEDIICDCCIIWYLFCFFLTNHHDF